MKKLFMTLGMGLALSACSTVPNPISQTQVYGLANGYGVAQSAAVAYTALPRCRAGEGPSLANICSLHGVIVQLADADQKARIALDALESFSRNPKNYPGLSFGALVSAAQDAIGVLKKIESNNQIGA